MTSMVERVARAIYEAGEPVYHDGHPMSWDDLCATWPHQKGRLVLARAAIEALREPTRVMVHALSHEIERNRPPAGLYPDAWNAAINAALSEE